MWIEVCLLLLAVLYCLHVWALTYWKRKGVFQLDGSIIFGNIKDILFMRKSMTACIWDIYKKHKHHKFVGIYGFYNPILIVTDPDAMRQIIVKDFNSFAGGAFHVDMKIDPMVAINPFSTQDVDLWKERRGLHVSMLSPSKLKGMPELIFKIGCNMINYIKEKNGDVKVKELTDLFAIDSVCSFSYGYEPSAFTDPENIFRKYALDCLFPPEATKAINSYFLYPFVAKLLRYRMVSKESEEFFISMCKKMMEYRKNNPSNRSDFFEHMAKVNAKLVQEGKEGVTDLELAGHSLTVYLDSFFTTSSGFSYLILELSKSPDFQEKLRTEILHAGQNIEDFDFEKVNSLSLLQMAITESLRIHSPVPITMRTCTKATEVEGIRIEPGTNIMLPYFAFHKDPQYFSDPETFNPGRFSSEASLVKGTLMPFGDGPRMCLGFRYASLLIKLGIIYLLLNFKILPEKKLDGEKEEMEKFFPFDAPDESARAVFKPIIN